MAEKKPKVVMIELDGARVDALLCLMSGQLAKDSVALFSFGIALAYVGSFQKDMPVDEFIESIGSAIRENIEKKAPNFWRKRGGLSVRQSNTGTKH
jgi:hypothetical protein